MQCAENAVEVRQSSVTLAVSLRLAMTLDGFHAPRTGLFAGPTYNLAALLVGRQRRFEAGARIRSAGRGVEGSWVHAYLHRKEGDQATPPTGTAGQASLFAGNRSTRDGSASWKRCWNKGEFARTIIRSTNQQRSSSCCPRFRSSAFHISLEIRIGHV